MCGGWVSVSAENHHEHRDHVRWLSLCQLDDGGSFSSAASIQSVCAKLFYRGISSFWGLLHDIGLSDDLEELLELIFAGAGKMPPSWQLTTFGSSWNSVSSCPTKVIL
jgi:hypothetical protein